VAQAPNGPLSRRASATIGIAPLGDALFQSLGRLG
jgi:hypothetical protein